MHFISIWCLAVDSLQLIAAACVPPSCSPGFFGRVSRERHAAIFYPGISPLGEILLTFGSGKLLIRFSRLVCSFPWTNFPSEISVRQLQFAPAVFFGISRELQENASTRGGPAKRQQQGKSNGPGASDKARNAGNGARGSYSNTDHHAGR